MSALNLVLPPAKEAAIPLELLENLRAGAVIGLVGSGPSIPLGMPTWRGLIDKIHDSVGAAAWRHDDQIDRWVRTSPHLEWVAEVLREDQPEAYARAILEVFQPKPSPPLSVVHALLAALPLRGYWTTNYDTTIEDYVAIFDRDQPRVLDFEEATASTQFMRDDRRFVLKLHGCVRKRPDKIVLTSSDYFHLTQDERYTRLLASLFSQYTLLTMGFSLHDKDFRRFLEERYHLYGRNCPPMYAVMGQKETCSLEVEVYRKKYNVQLVPISEEGNFRELTALLFSLYCLVHRIDSTASGGEVERLLRSRLKDAGMVRIDDSIDPPSDNMRAATRLLAVFRDPVDIDAFSSLCTDRGLGFSAAHFRIVGRAVGNRIVAALPTPDPLDDDRAAVARWLATKLEAVPIDKSPRYLSTHHKRIIGEHINTVEVLLLCRAGWNELVGDSPTRLRRVNEFFRQEGKWLAWRKIAETALTFVPKTSPVFVPLVRTLLWVFFWTRRYDDLKHWMSLHPEADAPGESSYALKLRYMQSEEMAGLVAELKRQPVCDYWQSSLLGRSLARLALNSKDPAGRAAGLEEAKQHLQRALDGARAQADIVETSVQSWYLACVCSDLGDAESAATYLSEVRRLDESVMGRQPGIAWLRVAEYRVAVNTARLAAVAHMKALEEVRRLGVDPSVAGLGGVSNMTQLCDAARRKAIDAMRALGMENPEDFVDAEYYY